MNGFKNVDKTLQSTYLIVGMNIMGKGSKLFSLPTFNMTKSTVQQVFKLVLANEKPPQRSISLKLNGSPYKYILRKMDSQNLQILRAWKQIGV
jgi:hypothetical protein